MSAAAGQPHWWQTRWFVLAAALIATIPLLYPTVPPLIDLPGHMGAYRVMLGTDAASLGQYYQFHWKFIGYLGGEAFIAATAPLIGLEAAAKLMACVIAVLTATGILWISREYHGRVQPLALFALPFTYNIAFQYGFINFTLSMAIALNAFALWLMLGRTGHVALRAAAFVPLSLAIWATHLFGWLVFGLLVFTAEVARARRGGRSWPASIWTGALHSLPTGLPALTLFVWRPASSAPNDYWQTLRYKPGWLAMALVDRWRPFDIASVAIAMCMLYYGLRGRAFERSLAAMLAAAGLFVVFLLMPFGTAYADARLLPYAIIIGLLAAGSSTGMPASRAQRLAIAGLLFFLVRIAAGTASMAIEGRDWDRRLAAVDRIAPGSRIAAFVTNRCRPDWRMQRLNHLPSMAIVRRGAFTNDQFDLGSTQTVKVVAQGMGEFTLDPSQMVATMHCPDADALTLSEALARFPRDRFDYLWLIDAGPFDPALVRGMTPIWRDDRDMLFRIAPIPVAAARRAS